MTRVHDRYNKYCPKNWIVPFDEADCICPPTIQHEEHETGCHFWMMLCGHNKDCVCTCSRQRGGISTKDAYEMAMKSAEDNKEKWIEHFNPTGEKHHCHKCGYDGSDGWLLSDPVQCPRCFHQEKQDWEARFDEMEKNHGWIPEHKERIKDFIRTLLQEAEKSAMLRQRNFDQTLIQEANYKGYLEGQEQMEKKMLPQIAQAKEEGRRETYDFIRKETDFYCKGKNMSTEVRMLILDARLAVIAEVEGILKAQKEHGGADCVNAVLIHVDSLKTNSK